MIEDYLHGTAKKLAIIFRRLAGLDDRAAGIFALPKSLSEDRT